MADQNAKIDQNNRKTLLAVTDDASAELRRLLVDASTGRLKISTTISGGVPQRVVSMADGTSFTPTSATADMNTQVNTQGVGTLTAAAPSGTPGDAQRLTIRIKSSSVQTFAWNAIYRGSTTIALPATTTGASKTDYFGFIYNSADTKWDCVAASYGYT